MVLDVDERIRLLEIRDTPLSVDEVLAAVADPAGGGVASFVGVVRDHDSERDVSRLDYTAHPTVTSVMRQVAEKVCATHPVLRLAAVHRVGSLRVGDLAVVVGVSCAHRGAAFDACRMMIDDLKATVPIWKHQVFADGTEEWVGTP
jgi:molybdopterin synthase catalytic subunit